jgi:hypothetical protein
MIVEERCNTLKPGTVHLYYQDYNPRGLRIQTRILGNLIGYFHTEIGELNQVVHLWGYGSLAERERSARCWPPTWSGRNISSSRRTSSWK